MWAVASAYLFQDLLCVRLKCYGPNVVLLDSGVPVRFYYLPVGASANAFETRRIAYLTVTEWLALLNRRMFHM
jgi:hypothetical protein